MLRAASLGPAPASQSLKVVSSARGFFNRARYMGSFRCLRSFFRGNSQGIDSSCSSNLLSRAIAFDQGSFQPVERVVCPFARDGNITATADRSRKALIFTFCAVMSYGHAAAHYALYAHPPTRALSHGHRSCDLQPN